jgi:hypothetical protein
MLERLERARLAQAWAHDTLFRKTEADKRVVVLLRSAPAWGLEPGTQRGLSLFSPRFNRAAFMLHAPCAKRSASRRRRNRPSTCSSPA